MEVRGGSLQGSQQSSPWGSPQSGGQWVVHRAGVSLFNSPVSLFTCREGHLSWQASPPGGSTKGTYGGRGVEKGL